MMEKCKKCEGVGVIEKDDKFYECDCSLFERIAISMPIYVRQTKIEPAHLKLEIIDLCNSSLYVVASWPDMRAIMKIMMIKYYRKFFRITSDRELRDIYVGSHTKPSEDGPLSISLQDHMHPPDLMLVRLNELKYKNRAASGLLEEAIMYRLDRNRPTWILSDRECPFGTDSVAYSKNLWDIFHNTLRCVEVPQISNFTSRPATKPLDDVPLAPEIEEAISGAMNKSKPKETTRKSKENDSDDVDTPTGVSIFGSGRKKPNKFGSRS